MMLYLIISITVVDSFQQYLYNIRLFNKLYYIGNIQSDFTKYAKSPQCLSFNYIIQIKTIYSECLSMLKDYVF